MARKLIQNALVLISLLGASFISLNAEETNSLFGVEGGMSSLRAETNTNGYQIQKNSMGHFGLKFGAESENFRVFFSGRNYLADDNNYLLTGGIEAQYKFNFSKYADFFIGGNGGIAYIEIGPSSVGSAPGIQNNTPYFGGDVGFNFHATESLDLEVGAKYMYMNTVVKQGTVTYDFRDLTSFYGSVIFKWQMD
ncbi:MAG: hypothetical protein COA30_06930 [Sulfurimonas sp.]|nr:MAG: hypothetical protein COA30_06930 [Sulfurimonas sp.]